MSDENDRPQLTLKLNNPGNKVVRQNLSVGRSKNVAVEIRKKKKPTIGSSNSRQDHGGLTNTEVEDRMQIVKRSLQEKVQREKAEQERKVQESLKAQNEAPITEAAIQKAPEPSRETTTRSYEKPTYERSYDKPYERSYDRKPYDPTQKKEYDPNRPPYDPTKKREYDPNRPPYDPAKRREYDSNRPPYDPTKKREYDPNRPPYDPTKKREYDPNRPPYDPTKKREYDPNRKPYDPTQKREYDPNRPPYDPTKKREYDPNRPPYDPTKKREYDPNRKPYDPTAPRTPYRGGGAGAGTPGGQRRPPYQGNNPGGYRGGSNAPGTDSSVGLGDTEETKRRAEFNRREWDKKASKKFADNPAGTENKDVKKDQYDKRQNKHVNLSRYRDMGNLGEDAYDAGGRAWLKKRQKNKKEELSEAAIARDVIIPKTIVVSELASRMAIRASDVIKKLMQQGMFVTVNQVIDGDIAELVCLEFGHMPKRVSEEDVEKVLTQEVNEADLVGRAPVVTVMGHVDHGKTSLLDALRKTSVVKGEAGGITQHIGAYRVFSKTQKPIVFIDTPGHAAFSSMRERGANITDIVILVVAGDDGVKMQTIEAIQHAKAAKVPIIVAVNKMDLPGADSNRVASELLNHDVVTEGFGGDVMIVEISAKTGMGLEKLEDDILLLAETLELKAVASQKAAGVVVESTQEKGRGAMATVLIQSGTLNIGDIFVVGKTHGKVKLMLDEYSKDIASAGPSTPVRILGLDGIPEAGDTFNVTDSEQTAIEIAESRTRRERDEKEAKKVKATGLEGFLQNVADSEVKVLPVIIKADVHGSAEAIKQSLEKLSDEQVRINVLHTAVGPISENDVSLAKAGHGVIIGFNVRANTKARDIAKQDNVEILYHSIIYKAIEDIQNIMKGFLKPVFRDKFIGYAEIRQIFDVTKTGKVAGCMITEGTVQRGAKIRLLRDNVVIHEGKLKTLRRFKDEVKEVRQGYECGVAFENYDDIRVGDIVECSIEEEVKA